MKIPRNMDPILSAMFLCSVSTHFIYQRRRQIEEKQRLVARNSILRGIYYRLRDGECIGATEYRKLMDLTSTSESVLPSASSSESSGLSHNGAIARISNLLSSQKVPRERSEEEIDKEVWYEWEQGEYFTFASQSRN